MAGIPLFSIKALTEGGGGGGGSGLPPVSGSGKALVSVNGQWVEQDGYGYTVPGTQTTIEWDGNPEGHYTVGSEYYKYCKVSDETPTSASLIGGSRTFNGTTCEITEETIYDLGEGVYVAADCVIVVSRDNVLVEGILFEQKGIYFVKTDDPMLPEIMFTSSLTYGTEDTVHKIDPKYLPEGIGYETEQESVIAEETVETAVDPGTGVIPVGMIMSNFELVEGNTYGVLFDGTEYECVCNKISVQGTVGYTLGAEPDIYSQTIDFSTFPFSIILLAMESGVLQRMLGTESAGTHNIKVTGKVPGVHKIDPKYLPPTVFITEIRDINGAAAYTHECDKSFYEIKNAFDSGQIVLAKYYGAVLFCVYCDNRKASFVSSAPDNMIFTAYDEGPVAKGTMEYPPVLPSGGNPGDVLTIGNWGPEWRGGSAKVYRHNLTIQGTDFDERNHIVDTTLYTSSPEELNSETFNRIMSDGTILSVLNYVPNSSQGSQPNVLAWDSDEEAIWMPENSGPAVLLEYTLVDNVSEI